MVEGGKGGGEGNIAGKAHPQHFEDGLRQGAEAVGHRVGRHIEQSKGQVIEGGAGPVGPEGLDEGGGDLGAAWVGPAWDGRLSPLIFSANTRERYVLGDKDLGVRGLLSPPLGAVWVGPYGMMGVGSRRNIVGASLVHMELRD